MEPTTQETNPDHTIDLNEASATSSLMPVDAQGKRGRGRPRKNKPDEALSTPLLATPLSSVPQITRSSSAGKRRGGKQVENVDEKPSGSDSLNQDVLTKVRYSQEGARAIIILSGNGTISEVQLKNSDSAVALTYEGRFEILTLSGSFSPTGNGETKSISDRTAVTLAARNGAIFGGVVDGHLTVAEPVLVVYWSFLPAPRQEHSPEKHKSQPSPSTTPADTHTTAAELKSAPSPSAVPGNNPVFRDPSQALKDISTIYESSSTEEKDSDETF